MWNEVRRFGEILFAMWREGVIMENLYLCLGLIIVYIIMCGLYAKLMLRGKNAYLRYNTIVFIVLHSGTQVYLVCSKWKQVLLQTNKLTYLQWGVLILGVVALSVNIWIDRYIIKQELKKEKNYCLGSLDALRVSAKEKGASKDIQDLLRYMTPKKSDKEDEKIQEIISALTEENMEASYVELKSLINLREEKLKSQCK